MKNKEEERGRGGLNREGGLINFSPLKKGGLLERGWGRLFHGGLNRRFTKIELKSKRLLQRLIKQREKAEVYNISTGQYQSTSGLLGKTTNIQNI